MDQKALWNGPSGQAWVESQELLDQVFRPLEDLLVNAVGSATRVLDVGCGTGSTTLALGARATGVDISEPMIALARARAARQESRPEFIVADAQRYAFEPASFDMIVSRFGVMFFDDPARAFANLRRAAMPASELRVIVWRSPKENAFMTAAERAATPLLPGLPARRPDGPGQFAFADSSRVRRILEDSGWSNVDHQPLDVECTLPAKELDHYVTRMGPVARALQDADDETRARVTKTVRAAFDPFVRGDAARFVSACWMVSARR